MAKEVVLSFKLRKVKEAQGLAKRIKVDVGEANKLAVKARQEALKLKGIKEQAGDTGRKVKAYEKWQKRKNRLRARAGRLQVNAAQNVFRGGEALGVAAERIGAAQGYAAAGMGFAATGGVGGLGAFGALAGGPLAAIVGVVAMMGGIIQAKLQESHDAAMVRLREEITAKIDEDLRKADYNRRLNEDAVFAKREARRHWKETALEELRLSRSGLSPQRDILESF